jgi:hypothetical protein
MKFMIINRPTGGNAGRVSGDPKELRAHAKRIREWIDRRHVECCYHMVSGGHVYVINTDSIEGLQLAVRGNPLFEESHTDVIPITDAADFLEGYASHVEKRARS